MVSPEVSILDVGHGNTGVLLTDHGAVVFDAAPGSTLIEFLEDRATERIDFVLISHADADHVGGLISLLSHSDVDIGTVMLNPDPIKDTDIWDDLRAALEDANTRGTVHVVTALNTATSIDYAHPDIAIEVLAPRLETALSGAGGQDLGGHALTSNSMSVVFRITTAHGPQLLLAGDIDSVGLANLLSSVSNLRARILVFPHHGGLPGSGDPFEFARRLCEAVRPQLVVFSIGRGRHGTPRPEIVSGVRAALPDVHIACTQLSEHCAAALPASLPTHLSPRPAQGRPRNSCCAGTILIDLGESHDYMPLADQHRRFIKSAAPTALCLKENTMPPDRS